jgi:hypothetical protein
MWGLGVISDIVVLVCWSRPYQVFHEVVILNKIVVLMVHFYLICLYLRSYSLLLLQHDLNLLICIVLLLANPHLSLLIWHRNVFILLLFKALHLKIKVKIN